MTIRTRLGAERHNRRMDKIMDEARRLEKDRIGRGEKPNPNLTGCQWFARCDRPAVDVVKHPILGYVPVCQRCKDRVLKAQWAVEGRAD